MNCAECQTDPLTPGHYCPCCGRKLSLEEQRAAEGASPSRAPVVSTAAVTEAPRAWTPAAAPQAPAVHTTPVVVAPVVAAPPPVVNADELKIANAKAVADMTAKAHLAKAANPAPVARRPIVPAVAPAPGRSRTPMLMIAAVVIVGLIGAAEGARRMGFDWPRGEARETPPVQSTPAATPSPTDTAPETKVVAASRSSAMAPPRAVVKPRANARVTQRAPVRQADVSAERVAPVAARTAVRELPAPAPSPSVAPETARPAATLTGRLYESGDVDQPPRIANRVEPRLPANVAAAAQKKIVVARVLVSRTGQPHRVSLLRGSTLGQAADDAVVAAVTQWTFSPAMKRGEPVNCWYNIGVPLAQAR